MASWKPGRFEWIVIVWLVTCVCLRSGMGTAHAWHDRTGLQAAAEGIANQVRVATQTSGFVSDEAIVYVYGQPALLFGLKASGLSLVAPIQEPAFPARILPRPTFLVARRADSDPGGEPSREDLLRGRVGSSSVSHLVTIDEGLGSPWRLYYNSWIYSPNSTIRFRLIQQSP